MKKFYNLICDLRELIYVGVAPRNASVINKKINEIESFMAGLEYDLIKCLDKYYRSDLSDKL